MNFANRVKVEHRTDHYLLSFAFAASEDPNESGEPTVSIAIPVTLATNLLIELFKGAVFAPVEVQEFFADFQLRLGEVTRLSNIAGERAKALQVRQLEQQKAALLQLVAAQTTLQTKVKEAEQK